MLMRRILPGIGLWVAVLVTVPGIASAHCPHKIETGWDCPALGDWGVLSLATSMLLTGVAYLRRGRRNDGAGPEDARE
jgi:hypothetical protein